MIEELQRSLRVIHDLERAIRLWELLRDNAQRAADETRACSERERDPVESALRVAKFQAYIFDCNTSILATKARIDRLERGDQKYN
jgi:hypothetical protein